MEHVVISVLSIALMTTVISSGAQAAVPEFTKVDSDKLRRENLDRDQNNLGQVIQKQLNSKVDFDQLRRDNLDKDQNDFDRLTDDHMIVKVNFDQLRRDNLDTDQNNFDQVSQTN